MLAKLPDGDGEGEAAAAAAAAGGASAREAFSDTVAHLRCHVLAQTETEKNKEKYVSG